MYAKKLLHISLFVVLLTICSWISIPIIVPITFQTFAVFLAIFLLGGKSTTIIICVYILLGIIGVPVFSNGTSGINRILGISGGYLIGLIFCTLTVWFFELIFKKRIKNLIIPTIIGMLICYFIGTLWFIGVYSYTTGKIGIISSLYYCVIPFIVPDFIKLYLALKISKKIKIILLKQSIDL